VQAKPSWSPPTGPLGRLSAAAESRAEALGSRLTELRSLADSAGPRPAFAASLLRSDVAVIAELKRRSPSKGIIDATLDAAQQTAAYAGGGASALSVLTEPTEFGGSPDDLRAARRATTLPVLKKDFHVQSIQLLEAAGLGASAVLLIARALTPDRLRRLAYDAQEFGVEVLVEVRSDEELEHALAIDHAVIGVNSRNLETLEVDERIPERLLPKIPPRVVRVWESGVHSVDDVKRAAACGADAVLVGSALSRSADPAALIRSLGGVPRRGGT
jgi:indole-3-glycerol phosphate synthase